MRGGARPGGPELPTLRAHQVLQTAAVVRYDNLARSCLLALASVACACIYAGKKPYGDYTPQEVIHALIAKKR